MIPRIADFIVAVYIDDAVIILADRLTGTRRSMNASFATTTSAQLAALPQRSEHRN